MRKLTFIILLSIISSANAIMAQQWSAITNNDIWNLNSGNIGIGTTTPDTKLHIWTWTPGITNLLKLENRYASSNTNHGEGIFFKGYYKQALIKAFQNPESFFGGDLQLQTYLDENTLNPGIYLNRLGNVGIGTITPNYKLEITGNSFVNGNLKIGTPTDNTTIYNGNYGNGAIIKLPNLASGNDEISVLNTPQTYTKTKTFSNSTYSALFTGGNVGIGTTTPKSKLELVSGINAYPAITGTTQSGAALRLRGGDNAVLDFGMNSNNTWIQATDQTGLGSNYNISLNPNGGNVGIGTSIPSQSLDVIGRTAITSIGINSDEGYNGALMITKPDNSGQYINMVRDGQYPWSIGTVYNTNTFAIGEGLGQLGNHTDADFTNPFFNITDGGNVGIGTTIPGAKLDVAGNISSTSISSTNTGDIGGLIHLNNHSKTANGQAYRWSIYNMAEGEPYHYGNSLQFWAYDKLGDDEVSGKTTATGGMVKSVLTLKDDGNVGIGTNTPGTKLEVAGNIKINSGIDDNHIYWAGHNMTMGTQPGDYSHNVFSIKPGGAANGSLFSILNMQ